MGWTLHPNNTCESHSQPPNSIEMYIHICAVWCVMFCTLHANKKYWWDRSQSNAEKGKKTKEIKERRRLPLWKTSGMNINIRIWTAAAAIVTVATTVLVQAPTNPIGKNHFKYHKSYTYTYIYIYVRCTLKNVLYAVQTYDFDTSVKFFHSFRIYALAFAMHWNLSVKIQLHRLTWSHSVIGRKEQRGLHEGTKRRFNFNE